MWRDTIVWAKQIFLTYRKELPHGRFPISQPWTWRGADMYRACYDTARDKIRCLLIIFPLCSMFLTCNLLCSSSSPSVLSSNVIFMLLYFSFSMMSSIICNMLVFLLSALRFRFLVVFNWPSCGSTCPIHFCFRWRLLLIITSFPHELCPTRLDLWLYGSNWSAALSFKRHYPSKRLYLLPMILCHGTWLRSKQASIHAVACTILFLSSWSTLLILNV